MWATIRRGFDPPSWLDARALRNPDRSQRLRDAEQEHRDVQQSLFTTCVEFLEATRYGLLRGYRGIRRLAELRDGEDFSGALAAINELLDGPEISRMRELIAGAKTRDEYGEIKQWVTRAETAVGKGAEVMDHAEALLDEFQTGPRDGL
jgi:hypothetical protein